MQVALLSPFVQREVLRSGHGVSEDDPVVLPKQVCAAVQLCRISCTCDCQACRRLASSRWRIDTRGVQVTAEVLQLLLTYCRYHRVPGHSDKERKAFDEKFIRLDTRRLCELTSAADR
jgi:hypothetical protein